MWAFIALILTLAFLLKYAYTSYFGYWKKRGVKERPSYFTNYFFNKHTIVRWDTDNYEALKGHKFGGMWEMSFPVLYLRDLELIKQILTKDFEYFVNRRTFPTNNEKDHTKLMLSFRETQDWKDMRKILTPAFSTAKMRRLFLVFNSCAKGFTKYLLTKCDQPLEFRQTMGKYTMACIAESIFGIDCDPYNEEPSKFFVMGKTYMDFNPPRLFKLIFCSNYPKIASFLGLNVFDQDADTYLTQVVEDVLRSRRGKTEKYNDFLEIMRENSEEMLLTDDGEGKKVLSEHEIVAQCMNFFAAGSDSIETALIWGAYELAKQSDIQEKLYKEIADAMEEDGGELTFDRLMDMEYMDLFISECLRMYPPTQRAERRCLKDYKIAGTDFTVPKGLFAHIPIYAIHHDPEYWPKPDTFDPERFTKENKATRNAYAYMPFGHGPRSCIAARYSIIEAKVGFAHFVKNFEVLTCSKTEVKPTYFPYSLKPLNGTWLSLKPRKA